MTDYYKILEVSPKASTDEIAKAYKQLAARYHPDKHRGNELEALAAEKLVELNQAYDVLSNPHKRAQYDGTRGVRGAPSNAPPSRSGEPQDLFRNIGRTLLVVAIVYFSLRFVRSPRGLALIGILLLIAWFGPRIWRKISRK